LFVVELRAAVHRRIGDLCLPLCTMVRRIDLLAGAGNGPTTVQRFHPGGKSKTNLTLTGLLLEGLGEWLQRHLAHSWVVANIDLLFALTLR
jgi:hypothetical protein